MSNTRGFTLLELMITLVVLSVGLLGVASLLVRSLHGQSAALRHHLARELTADMAQRIRANPQGAEHYTTAGEARIVRGSCGTDPGCIPRTLAERDVADFLSAVQAAFAPLAPEATLTFAPATGAAQPGRVDIVIRWWDAREGEALDELRTVVLTPAPVAG
jgi:type IV pilus modification protein PilV